MSYTIVRYVFKGKILGEESSSVIYLNNSTKKFYDLKIVDTGTMNNFFGILLSM